MEGQSRRELQSESWIDNISAGFEEERDKSKSPGRFLVAVSIFFGVSGIIAGLLFFHKNYIPEPLPQFVLQSNREIPGNNKSVVSNVKLISPKKNLIGSARTLPPALKGVTIFEIKNKAVKKKSTPTRGKQEFIKKENTLTTVSSRSQKQKKVIDLTNQYRLTSTGMTNSKKYVTIGGNDYYINEEFMEMTITDIGKDRVYLKGKGDGNRYVIIFRYRKH